jgi:hypothetical protein
MHSIFKSIIIVTAATSVSVGALRLQDVARKTISKNGSRAVKSKASKSKRTPVNYGAKKSQERIKISADDFLKFVDIAQDEANKRKAAETKANLFMQMNGDLVNQVRHVDKLTETNNKLNKAMNTHKKALRGAAQQNLDLRADLASKNVDLNSARLGHLSALFEVDKFKNMWENSMREGGRTADANDAVRKALEEQAQARAKLQELRDAPQDFID